MPNSFFGYAVSNFIVPVQYFLNRLIDDILKLSKLITGKKKFFLIQEIDIPNNELTLFLFLDL